MSKASQTVVKAILSGQTISSINIHPSKASFLEEKYNNYKIPGGTSILFN